MCLFGDVNFLIFTHFFQTSKCPVIVSVDTDKDEAESDDEEVVEESNDQSSTAAGSGSPSEPLGPIKQ